MFIKPKGVKQEHIWVAEYYRGCLREFEDEKTENSFYDIDRDELVRFGLSDIGWFECYRGVFNLRGQVYEVIYKYGDVVVPLTGMDMKHKDIITYKKAYAEADLSKKKGQFTNKIIAFYFGYKAKFKVDGLNFNFKPIVCKSVGGEMYLDIHLVVNRDLDGDIIILKNGNVADKFKAPLEKDVTGGIQWIIK